MKNIKLLIILGALVTLTVVSGFLLSSNLVHADNDSSVSSINIQVNTSCTLKGGSSGTTPGGDTYTASIDPGTYEEIAGSKLVTLCNDSGGYSLYAIGYSGDTYDTSTNTKMLGEGSIGNINTGTSGTNSYWAMKLEAVTGTTPPTILNNFDNYHVVPESFTQIAGYTATTTQSTGSTVQTKYKINISSTQGTGIYTGKVKYTMVHPNNTYVGLYSITYNKNTTDTVTNMPTNIENEETNVGTITLSSNTPARDGYNFEGWCTVAVADGAACTGTSYPAGGVWTLDQTQSSNSLTLYAMWAAASHCKPTGTTITTIGCMQDITSSNKSSVLGSMTQGTQYQLYDSRDDQQYWVARQADGNIWMTQNLDLDIGGTGVAALTSDNTDLNTSGSGIYVDGYDNSTGVIIWTPDNTAKTSNHVISGTTVPDWANDNNEPYSAEGGDRYYYTTGTDSDETAQTLAECTAVSGRSEEDCAHYHSGNYYNWTAAIASNASSGISTQDDVAANSICPKGWKLPQGRTSTVADPATRQFGNLWYTSGITTSVDGSRYDTGGFNKIRTSPLFFVRGGVVFGSSLDNSGSDGLYWSGSVRSTVYAYRAYFDSSDIFSANFSYRNRGLSIRCMVR